MTSLFRLMFASFWVLCAALNTGSVWAKPVMGGPVYVYVSPTTDRYLQLQDPEHNQYGDTPGKRWRQHLANYGEQASEITREQLLAGLKPGLLILPAAVALDSEERHSITNFAARGGSLLGSGQIGTRDATGQYVGLDFLHTTFRVQTQGFFAATDDAFLIPYGDGPLTWPIPAARRMPISLAQDSILRLQTDSGAAVLMDWARSRTTEAHTIMAFDEQGDSRVAYFSFPDNALPRSRDTTVLMDSTVAWLRHQPQAYKAAWPKGYVAAHLIEMDTEDQFFSAPSFAKHLESEGFKGTFYCLTSLAVEYPNIVRDLMARGHEIAYHADVHFGFKGDKRGEQELRILFMKQQMQTVIGDRIHEATGFRAPTESYDSTTEMLLRKHGLRHHAADESAHQDRLPFFSTAEPGIAPDQALVVLPRTQLDDVSFMELKYSPEQVTATLNDDLDLTVRSGALGLLSVHSQNYIKGGLMLRTMGDYMHKVASYRDRLWVARGDEIADWWRKREVVKVEQRLSEEALFVRLETALAVRDLSVFVTLPYKNASLRVATTTQSTAVHVKPIDAYRAALVFDTLEPGETLLKVTFD